LDAAAPVVKLVLEMVALALMSPMAMLRRGKLAVKSQ